MDVTVVRIDLVEVRERRTSIQGSSPYQDGFARTRGKASTPTYTVLYRLSSDPNDMMRTSTDPRSSEDVPFVDLELLAQGLDVLDKVPGGVFFKARARGGLPRSALVEEDDLYRGRRVSTGQWGRTMWSMYLVLFWVEEGAVSGIDASTGATCRLE